MQRMQVEIQLPVITVGGTNGKGSTCAMLESILRVAAIAPACTARRTSSLQRARAHSGIECDDRLLCEASRGRGGAGRAPLTYFEYGTLAAFWIFAREKVDALVLEVGLGGRLDAVNASTTDCAVLTSVGIDHVDFLGPTANRSGARRRASSAPAARR
jgi:dihydrofolate synthase/folylpolyglutamate synthase